MPAALLLCRSLTCVDVFFLDLHTEAVQAALAKYKERKMPMPSKRRSVLVQSSVEACTPPGETSVPVNPTVRQRQGLSCLGFMLTLGCLHVLP